jgi:hypothetical protein
MGVKVPFLPIHGVMEATLFTRLVLELPSFDESLMAIEWCKHADAAADAAADADAAQAA